MEDQVERILQKYWSDAPQIVILKIDSAGCYKKSSAKKISEKYANTEGDYNKVTFPEVVKVVTSKLQNNFTMEEIRADTNV